MRDFVVARCNDMWGYISTDKEHKHGFEETREAVFKKLNRLYGKFTYAENGELILFDGQRKFTNKDKILANKLNHYKTDFDLQQALFMSRLFEGR